MKRQNSQDISLRYKLKRLLFRFIMISLLLQFLALAGYCTWYRYKTYPQLLKESISGSIHSFRMWSEGKIDGPIEMVQSKEGLVLRSVTSESGREYFWPYSHYYLSHPKLYQYIDLYLVYGDNIYHLTNNHVNDKEVAVLLTRVTVLESELIPLDDGYLYIESMAPGIRLVGRAVQAPPFFFLSSTTGGLLILYNILIALLLFLLASRIRSLIVTYLNTLNKTFLDALENKRIRIKLSSISSPEIREILTNFTRVIKKVRRKQVITNHLLKQQQKQLLLEKEVSDIFIHNSTQQSFSKLQNLLIEEFRADSCLILLIEGHEISELFYKSRTDNHLNILSSEYRAVEDELLKRLQENNGYPQFTLDKTTSIYGNMILDNAVLFPIIYNEIILGIVQLDSLKETLSSEELDLIYLISLHLSPIFSIIREKMIVDNNRRKSTLAIRKSEEKYRTIYEESSDIIFHINRDGNFQDINPAGIQLLDFKNRSEALEANLFNFFYFKDEVDFLREKMEMQSYLKDHEIVLKVGDRKIYGLENAVAFLDARGHITGYHGTIKDITELTRQSRELWEKHLELEASTEELKKTQTQIIQNEKMASIGQLSAGIAHEINNPLGFIKSNFTTLGQYLNNINRFIEAVRENNQEIYKEEKLEYIKEDTAVLMSEIQEGFKRIMSIVNNLKNFSRIDSLEQLEKVNINQLIDSTLIIARNEYKYASTIEKRFKEISPVECHGNQISQVLLNIIVNAAHAVAAADRDEMGTIIIETGQKEDSVTITVTDTGAGIDESHLNSIFDPFFTTKDVGVGTGLGLSISYDIIVNKHGGKLSAHNREDAKGAVFTVSLPIIYHGGEDNDQGETMEEIRD